MKTSVVLYCTMIALAAVALSCAKTLTLDDGDKDASPSERDEKDAAQSTPDATSAMQSPSDGGDEVVVWQWSGGSSECPAGVFVTGDACSVPEGSICAYTTQDSDNPTQSSYNECTCVPDCGGADTRWYCTGAVWGSVAPCPTKQPENKSACSDLRGGDACNYPVGVECRCRGDADTAEWSCGFGEGVDRRGQHPAAIDESVAVRDLSPDQRLAWCEWLTQPAPGQPAWPELEPRSDGFYPQAGCGGSRYLSCAFHMPIGYAASACVANLELSSCQAPLYELTECALTAHGKYTGHGCGNYLDAPGCEGTIVLDGAFEEAGQDCRLRVR